MTSHVEKLKKEFLEYLEVERGRSIKTIENYDRYLRRFLEFAKSNSPADITEELVRKYRLYLNRIGESPSQKRSAHSGGQEASGFEACGVIRTKSVRNR